MSDQLTADELAEIRARVDAAMLTGEWEEETARDRERLLNEVEWLRAQQADTLEAIRSMPSLFKPEDVGAGMNREQMVEKAASWLFARKQAAFAEGWETLDLRQEAESFLDAILPQVSTVEELEGLPLAAILPCCNYREDIDAPCLGTMTLAWPEYVCDTCRGRCGAQVHRQCVDEWNVGASNGR